MQCLYLSSMAWHMLCGLPDTGSESFKSCNICNGKRVLFFSSTKSPKARGVARTGHPGQLTLKESEWAGRRDLYRDGSLEGRRRYVLPALAGAAQLRATALSKLLRANAFNCPSSLE
jgi:hypothetical protein